MDEIARTEAVANRRASLRGRDSRKQSSGKSSGSSPPKNTKGKENQPFTSAGPSGGNDTGSAGPSQPSGASNEQQTSHINPTDTQRSPRDPEPSANHQDREHEPSGGSSGGQPSIGMFNHFSWPRRIHIPIFGDQKRGSSASAHPEQAQRFDVHKQSQSPAKMSTHELSEAIYRHLKASNECADELARRGEIPRTDSTKQSMSAKKKISGHRKDSAFSRILRGSTASQVEASTSSPPRAKGNGKLKRQARGLGRAAGSGRTVPLSRRQRREIFAQRVTPITEQAFMFTLQKDVASSPDEQDPGD